MDEQHRRTRTEMNLDTLPFALLDKKNRDKIEYYGTFTENGIQQEMTWIVSGGPMGLPTEFSERVMVVLLYIGSRQGFKDRKMSFSIYEILQILDRSMNSKSYREVKDAITKMVTLAIYTDQAWYDHAKKKRVSSESVFHLIDRVNFKTESGSDIDESYIVWGEPLWDNIQAGYLKYTDLDFYLGLPSPTSRRLFKLLDKMMAYGDRWQVDIFALQDKLGLTPRQYPSQLKPPISKAAQELVDCNWLSGFEYVKFGKFLRVVFYKSLHGNYQLPLFDDGGGEEEKTLITPSIVEDNSWLNFLYQCESLDPQTYRNLVGTKILSTIEGVIKVSAGARAEWLQNRVSKNRSLIRTLNTLLDESIKEVEFVE